MATFTQAWGPFRKACIEKLRVKGRQGWTGWACPGFIKDDWPWRFWNHVGKVVLRGFQQDDLVDLANFLMFKWHALEQEKTKGEER